MNIHIHCGCCESHLGRPQQHRFCWFCGKGIYRDDKWVMEEEGRRHRNCLRTHGYPKEKFEAFTVPEMMAAILVNLAGEEEEWRKR